MPIEISPNDIWQMTPFFFYHWDFQRMWKEGFFHRHVSRTVMLKLCIWLMWTWRIRTIICILDYKLINTFLTNGNKERHPQRPAKHSLPNERLCGEEMPRRLRTNVLPLTCEMALVFDTLIRHFLFHLYRLIFSFFHRLDLSNRRTCFLPVPAYQTPYRLLARPCPW